MMVGRKKIKIWVIITSLEIKSYISKGFKLFRMNAHFLRKVFTLKMIYTLKGLYYSTALATTTTTTTAFMFVFSKCVTVWNAKKIFNQYPAYDNWYLSHVRRQIKKVTKKKKNKKLLLWFLAELTNSIGAQFKEGKNVY